MASDDFHLNVNFYNETDIKNISILTNNTINIKFNSEKIIQYENQFQYHKLIETAKSYQRRLFQLNSSLSPDTKLPLILNESETLNNNSKEFNSTISNISQISLHSTMSQAAQHQTPSHSNPSSPNDEIIVFLGGLGWCIKTPQSFTCYFNDGISVELLPQTQTCIFEDFSTTTQIRIKKKLDKNLPDKIKVKLAEFPRFIEEFKRKQNIM